MRKIFLLAFLLGLYVLTSAQSSVATQDTFNKILLEQTNETYLEKGATGSISSTPKTVKIYPNPVADHILYFDPINVTIVSYQVFKSTGEIVEIENLIGKDEFEIILLGSILPGLYFVTFQTSAGPITKYFTVI
jgi:hypothetical protein